MTAATCTITVTGGTTQPVAVTGVELNKSELTLAEGATATLTATVEPDGATTKTVTWSTSDDKVATVAQDGTVTAVAKGEATITVETTDGKFTDTCTVTVNCTGGTFVAKKDASCTEEGMKAHWFCSNCKKYFADNSGACGDETSAAALKLGKTEHEWQVVVKTYPDGSETHEVECANCTETATHAHAQEQETLGEWTGDETSHWKTYGCGTRMGVAAHTFGEPAETDFHWTNDYDECTVDLTCTECKKTVTKEMTVTDKVTTPAACTEKGWTTYTATITLGGAEYTDTKDVQDINALGHSYGDAVFTWADDGQSATAERVCANDTNHVLSGNAAITPAVKTPATCEGKGTTTYTAKITLDGQDYTAKKDIEDINALGHSYQLTSKVWNNNCTECVFTFTCDRGVCGDVKTVTASNTDITSQADEDKPATCKDMGWTNYTATVTFEGAQYTATTALQNIELADHVYGTLIAEVPATCTTDGVKAHYHCSVCGKDFNTEKKELESLTIDALNHDWATGWSTNDTSHWKECTHEGCDAKTQEGSHHWHDTDCTKATYCEVCEKQKAAGEHTWGEVAYDWQKSGETYTCTAAVECTSCHATDTNIAAVTSEVTTEPACETKGVRTYTADFTEDWAADQPYTEDIAPLGHDWDAATYEWAEDGSACTARRVCKRAAGHVETATATVSSKVTTPATCEAKGVTTYTATFTEDWASNPPTKTLTNVKALGHDYGEAEFTWAEDGKSATAKRVCKNNAGHVLTGNAAITSEVTTLATCEGKGKTKYTATITLGDQEYTETKTLEDIAALGHNFTEKIVDPDHLNSVATCQHAAVYCYDCSRCEQKSTTDTFASGSTTPHTYGADGKCACGAVNPMKDVKTDSIATATNVGGETVAVEAGKQIVADDSGLAVKTNISVDLNDVKEAVAAGSTVVKIDEKVNTTIPDDVTDGGKAAVEALKNVEGVTPEQQNELDKIAQLVSYNATAAKPNVKVEQVVDVSLELVTVGTGNTLGEIKELPQPIEIRIPASQSLINAFNSSNKVVKAIISHTEVNGDVTSKEVDVTYDGSTGEVIIRMDAFSTVAFVTYENVGGGSHGSGSSAPTGARTITTDLPVGSINAVFVNGKKLDSKYYVINGSSVTLTEAYMSTLKAGRYTIRIENATHMSTATIEVAADGVLSARTGDAGLGMWYAMMGLSALLAVALVVKKRREA